MRSVVLAMLVILLASAMPALAMAQSPGCATLGPDARALATKIMDTQLSYGCCTDTISRCLAEKKTCAVSQRLAENICHRVSKGETEEKIIRRLTGRAKSMNPGAAKAVIDLSKFDLAGSATAPVTVVVYACARCPFCARLVLQLHASVTTGKLKNKVALAVKPYPIKSHALGKEGGLALVAAQQMGNYWPLLLKMYSEYTLFSLEKIQHWSAGLGMDSLRFNKVMNDPSTTAILVDSKKEGLINGVDSTPTIFINGRRWWGFLDIHELEDALGEEYSRLGASSPK